MFSLTSFNGFLFSLVSFWWIYFVVFILGVITRLASEKLIKIISGVLIVVAVIGFFYPHSFDGHRSFRLSINLLFLLFIIIGSILSIVEDKNKKLISCFLIIVPVICYIIGFIIDRMMNYSLTFFAKFQFSLVSLWWIYFTVLILGIITRLASEKLIKIVAAMLVVAAVIGFFNSYSFNDHRSFRLLINLLFLFFLITGVILSVVEDKNKKLIGSFLIIVPVICYTVGFISFIAHQCSLIL